MVTAVLLFALNIVFPSVCNQDRPVTHFQQPANNHCRKGYCTYSACYISALFLFSERNSKDCFYICLSAFSCRTQFFHFFSHGPWFLPLVKNVCCQYQDMSTQLIAPICLCSSFSNCRKPSFCKRMHIISLKNHSTNGP